MATTATMPPKKAFDKAETLLARYVEVSKQLDRLETERKPLQEEYKNLRNELQKWADDEANAGAFAEKATLSLATGSFGYKNGPESLAWDLEKSPRGADRNEEVCAVLKKLLPTALKTTYDEKAIIKVWAHMPKLREQLMELGAVTVERSQQFIVTVSK